MLLHGLMAIAIFAMFGLGLYMVELTYYDAWYKGSLDLHKSAGILLMAALIFRIFWRAVNINPEAPAGPRWEQLSAHFMHIGLYLIMLLLMVSGYLISTADGRAIVVFETIDVAALPWAIENQEDIAGTIHAVLAWLLISMAAVHALAAFKHHFVNGNNILSRMFKVSSFPNSNSTNHNL